MQSQTFHLDHVIIACRHLEPIEALFRERLNIELERSGRHEEQGTCNALASGGASQYIEALACTDPDRASHPFAMALTRYSEPTLWAYVIRTSGQGSEEQFRSFYTACGADMMGPTQLSRVTPEGQRLTWQMFAPIGAQANSLLPLGIVWDGDMPQDSLPENNAVMDLKISADDSLAQALQAIGLSALIAPGRQGPQMACHFENAGRQLTLTSDLSYLPFQGSAS